MPTRKLLQYTEQVAISLKTKEEAEQLLRILLKRVPKLEQQEKELHKVGRKIRKRLFMKPIKD